MNVKSFDCCRFAGIQLGGTTHDIYIIFEKRSSYFSTIWVGFILFEPPLNFTNPPIAYRNLSATTNDSSDRPVSIGVRSCQIFVVKSYLDHNYRNRINENLINRCEKTCFFTFPCYRGLKLHFLMHSVRRPQKYSLRTIQMHVRFFLCTFLADC